MPVKLPGGGGGGGAKLNVFTGTTMPTTKNGIWINSSQSITNVIQDNDIWTPNTFYNTGTVMSTSFFLNQGGMNKIFYYNGYIYKFQNNTYGKGLFRAPINTAVFTLFVSVVDAEFPMYGLAQDPINPRYLYGLIGHPSNDNERLHKYDLDTGAITNVAYLSYPHWTSSYQNAVFYNGSFYGFHHNSSSQGGSPIGIIKYDTVNLNVSYMTGVSDLSYPKMELIGSNLYILFSSGNTLGAKKIDLITGTMSTMTLSGSTTLVANSFAGAILVTDGANKIYFMVPLTGSSGTSNIMYVLNVETGVVTSYQDTSIIGVQGHYFGMLYYNGTIYIYGVNATSTSTYSIFHFKLTGKSYPSGTFVISRNNNNVGTYNTELITPQNRPSGTYNLFNTGYNMAYLSINGQLSASQSVYNGNGTSWIQIR